MAWRGTRAWLGLAALTLGCEAVLGADFGDYEREIVDANGAGSRGGDASPPHGNGTGGTLGRGGTFDAAVPIPDRDTASEADSAAESQTGVPSVDASASDVARGDGIVADQARPIDASGQPRDGGCTPGEVNKIGVCGNCGVYLQACNPEGTWDPFVCKEESDAAVCREGWTEHRSCEGNGTLTATCTSACTWMLGDCMPPSNCMRDQMEEKPCGACGTQSRSCQAVDGGAWRWSPFSACMDTKACAAGTTEYGPCGNCGTRSRTCSNACTWNPWEACDGEGACMPRSAETRGCLIGLLQQTRTCSDSCEWGPWIGLCL